MEGCLKGGVVRRGGEEQFTIHSSQFTMKSKNTGLRRSDGVPEGRGGEEQFTIHSSQLKAKAPVCSEATGCPKGGANSPPWRGGAKRRGGFLHGGVSSLAI